MIRVEAAPEPESFDEKVRQPGLSALAELVGEPPLTPRPGPRRSKIADRREDIPAGALPPFWRESLGDLWHAYEGICAYVSIYIERVTGNGTVDHWIPKSQAWEQIYEWSNYRLACPLMNSRKGAVHVALDPFQIENDWFVLNLVTFEVLPGLALSKELTKKIWSTIDHLNLNDRQCKNVREDYFVAYQAGDISWSYLCRRAPFVAREVERQGRRRDIKQ